jgi:hypothetical protein
MCVATKAAKATTGVELERIEQVARLHHAELDGGVGVKSRLVHAALPPRGRVQSPS